MKICMILEGSFPFVRGGVSKWIADMLHSMPEDEFIVWAIGDSEEKRGKYVVDLPENIVAVEEAFMDTALNERVRKGVNVKITPEQKQAISELVHCNNPDLNILLKTFGNQSVNPDSHDDRVPERGP